MAQIFAFSAHPNPADVLPAFLVNWLWRTLLFGERLFLLLGPVGHLVNFGVLAFLLLRALVWTSAYKVQHAVLAFLIGVLYGVLDEIHQLFTPTRTLQVLDLVINGLGVLIGLTIFSILHKKQTYIKPEESLLL